jgi:nucleoside 2-deoxyribosyltransferase
MIRKLYLAGPDVFLPDAAQVGEAKLALCRRYGFEGLFPLDNEVPPAGSKPGQGLAIYRANVDLMSKADAVVANLTPFRGPSADAGTVFEVGFFAGRGKPIFAYSGDERRFADRTRSTHALTQDAAFDLEGLAIEDFDLPDNLMLPGAVEASGGAWVARSGGEGDIAAMEAFEACLKAINAAVERTRRQAKAG